MSEALINPNATRRGAFLLKFVALALVLGIPYLGCRKPAEVSSVRNLAEEKVMGVSVVLQLVKRSAYRERVHPAFSAFLGNGDKEPLMKLLQGARDNELGLVSTNEDDLLEMADFQLSMDVLSGKQLYCPNESWWSWEAKAPADAKTSQEDLNDYVLHVVGDYVANYYCLHREKGWVAVQSMGRTPLFDYLIKHRPWIGEMFRWEVGFSEGHLEPALGEGSDWVSDSAAKKLREEVRKVPRPTDSPKLQAEYDNLIHILDESEKNPDLGLVVTAFI